jgi:predicted Zn-dependent peptidase
MLRILILITVFFYSGIVSADDLAESESTQALKQLETKVKYYTLSNGLRVVLYRRGMAPVFSSTIAVKVGGIDETPGSTGLSHMLEHMAFKGTKTIGTKDYSKEKSLLDRLEKLEGKMTLGQKLNDKEQADYKSIMQSLKELWVLGDLNSLYDIRGAADLNATTDKELTKYFVSLPSNAFEFWCWIESERIVNPVMRQFYQERDVVLEERRMRFEDDPEGKLYENLLGVAYMRHPYRNPVVGYEADIRRLTADMAADLHNKYYVASNMVISLVGDIDPERDIKIIEKYFSRIPAGTPPPLNILSEAQQSGERRLSLKNNSAKHLYIAYHKPAYPDPDDPPISIMAEILSGSRVSPLYRRLVQNRRIATSIEHDETPGYAYPNLLLFGAQPNSPHDNNDVLKGFDNIIDSFQKTGATQEELDIAKRSVAMEYLAHLKSNISLAKDFATSAVIYDNYLASIDWYTKAMQVTLGDVKRVANKYLKRSNRTIATIDNQDEDVK